jgi:protein ImuB
VACVWYPDWPLRREDVPPDRPVIVVDPGSGVAACSPELAELGIRMGMARREAEALAPGAAVLVRDRGEEARRFEPVVSAVEALVPRVEVAEPGLMFVPVRGAVGYYGGEGPLVERLSKELDVLAPGASIGLADGPFAARWAAAATGPGAPRIVTDTAGFLAGLDVSLLGDADLASVFRWLGVTTLGELAGLPREALASRFGRAGLLAHRLASGEDRMVDPRPIPPTLAVEARYEEPLETLDRAGFAARSLAARLVEGLVQEGIAPYRVLVEVETEAGRVHSRVWRSADPFTGEALADRIRWQLRAWLDTAAVGSGIVRLRLDPSDLSGSGRQQAFFEDVAGRVEAERALARVQALVGPDAVLQAGPQGGRLPAEQVVWGRWGEDLPTPDRDPEAPWPGATPAPTPALVPPEPTPLHVEWDGGFPVAVRLGARREPVLSWSGPWRLLGRWWKGEGPVDRYQLVTSAGAMLCVVCEGRAYLAGVYD